MLLMFPDANRENEELIVLIADFFTKNIYIYNKGIPHERMYI